MFLLLTCINVVVLIFVITLVMKNNKELYQLVFLLIISILVSIGYCVLDINEYSYKQGQIDAINGKIKYELVKQPDGTTEWKEKKEEG